MIPVPICVEVWLATGHTDILKGFSSLALVAQEVVKRSARRPGFAFGDVEAVFEIIWHDGQAASLYVRRLERGGDRVELRALFYGGPSGQTVAA